MSKYTKQQYNEIFEKLPPEIKDVVADGKTGDKLWAIGQGHNLQIDQIGNMTDIALDVIMGVSPSRTMVDDIANECHISKIEANLIVRDIDDQILKPIKELMVKIYGEGAPYRPKSMNTIVETEADHIHLDKNELLHEIENPAPAEVKKVSVIDGTPISKVEVPKPTPAPIMASESKVIEERPEEIALGTVEKELPPKPATVEIRKVETPVVEIPKAPVTPAAPVNTATNPSLEEAKKRILDNLTSQKLSGIVTMSDHAEIAKIETPKPAAPKVNDAPKQYSTDPYREPLA